MAEAVDGCYQYLHARIYKCMWRKKWEWGQWLSCCLWEFIPWCFVVEFSMCFLTSVFWEEQQNPAALVSLPSSEALSSNEGCSCGVACWISTSPSDHLLVGMPAAPCWMSSSAWGLLSHSAGDTGLMLWDVVAQRREVAEELTLPSGSLCVERWIW